MTSDQDAVAGERGNGNTAPALERGWYLYGVTRQRPGAELLDAASSSGRTVQVVEGEHLTAVVSPVAADEFSPEVVAARAEDPAWLEAVVRAHNEVIATVHAEQAILPAKFGSVYADLPDLESALRQLREPLLQQLEQLEGTDEWAIHVYADRSLVREYVAGHHPDVTALKTELASARPGRAYFLQRKLTDTIAIACDHAMNDLAQAAFEHLARRSIASQVNPLGRAETDAVRVEILRAAFLVSRSDSDEFLQTVDSLRNDDEGLDVEVTGPWPAYSFAAVPGDMGQ